jgi:hypothetical protein
MGRVAMTDVYVAMALDKYDGGRGWVAVAGTLEAAQRLCAANHADIHEGEPLSPWWEVRRSSMFRDGLRCWTARVDPDGDGWSWYDVIKFALLDGLG